MNQLKQLLRPCPLLHLAMLLAWVLWVGGNTTALAQGAPNFGAPRALDDVLENMEGAPWSAVSLAASQQATVTLGPKHRNIPLATPFYAAFEGSFIPAADSTRLAIFSDDGCNVWIDGELVLNRLNLGQHLPNLAQSLRPLDYEMNAGVSYAIRIEYSNTLFTGTTDADGATLFAYTYDENQNRPYVEWRAGNPINCAGIRWPYSGATIAPGGRGLFARVFGDRLRPARRDRRRRDEHARGVRSVFLHLDGFGRFVPQWHQPGPRRAVDRAHAGGHLYHQPHRRRSEHGQPAGLRKRHPQRCRARLQR